MQPTTPRPAALRPHRPQTQSPRVSLSAAQLSKALGGHREGNHWKGRCPSHDDGTPSLSIKDRDDGRVLVHCFGGCTQNAVIDALRSRGLWSGNGVPFASRRPMRSPALAEFHRDPSAVAYALKLWNEALPPHETVVERYLRDERGLALPATADIRFHPRLRHSTGIILPGIVALMTDCLTRQPIGIHRTFLTEEGLKAAVDPDRMHLGPCKGGVVRLGSDTDTIFAGEGIETTLSAMVGSPHSGWASTSATFLEQIRLPRDVSEAVIVVDGDKAGKDAAAAITAKLQRAGKRVRHLVAPEGYDFNDVILGRVALPAILN